MAKGRKTGGRQLGTPNKSTQDLIEKCQAKGCDPFDVLLEYAASGTDDQRIAAAKELCQYLYPKRRAIEQSVDPSLLQKIKELEAKSPEEIVAIVKTIPHTDPVSTES